MVAERIRAKSPGIGIELEIIRTSGDERSEFGDEIESEVAQQNAKLQPICTFMAIDLSSTPSCGPFSFI
jgi:hypothetical protein